MTDADRIKTLADVLRRIERHVVARAAVMAREVVDPGPKVVAALEVLAETVTQMTDEVLTEVGEEHWT